MSTEIKKLTKPELLKHITKLENSLKVTKDELQQEKYKTITSTDSLKKLLKNKGNVLSAIQSLREVLSKPVTFDSEGVPSIPQVEIKVLDAITNILKA